MLTDKQNQNVYEGLFSQVKAKYEENGQNLKCDKTGYLRALGVAPKKIRYADMEDLDGEAFLSCVFLSLFQRIPSEDESLKCKDLSKEEILKYVANKASYSLRQIELNDCPYNIKPGLKGKVFKVATSAATSPSLRRTAKKMPRGIQKKIRGIFS